MVDCLPAGGSDDFNLDMQDRRISHGAQGIKSRSFIGKTARPVQPGGSLYAVCNVPESGNIGDRNTADQFGLGLCHVAGKALHEFGQGLGSEIR